MIRAGLGGFDRLAARLAQSAAAAGEAHIRARQSDPLRWRLPRLLWPNFTGGS